MPELTVKILSKVRSLLDKAESTEFPEEAEALQAKAFELMSLYGIEQAVLASKGEREDKIDQLVIDLSGAYAVGRAHLLTRISTALGAQGLYFPAGKRRPVAGYVVVAHESTRERIAFLYTMLFAQATRGMQKMTGGTPGRVRSARASYMLAFATVVGGRLDQVEGRVRHEEEAAKPGTGLVLVTRDRQVEQTYHQLYPRIRSVKAHAGSTAGYAAGLRDGERADLGGARFGNGRTKALG